MMDLEPVFAAVRGMADPAMSQQMRAQYMEVIQNYKENSFSLAHISTFIQSSDNVMVRLFGLQCCEFCVTKRWISFTPEQKEVFRDGMLKLLEEFQFASDAGEETRLFNSQMGRVFAELLKREWPQTWPDLVARLLASGAGSTGKQSVVLGILLRLCQDLVELGGEGLPGKRRSEVMAGLHANMDLIFNTLVQTVINYEAAPRPEAQENGHASPELGVCRQALETLMAYVDWVGLQYSCQGNGVFLEVLCRFLTLPAIRTQAAEVLLVLMRRKGKPEEKEQLKIAWENPKIFDALDAAVSNLAVEHPDDAGNYAFTLRLCQLVAATGTVMLQLREPCYAAQVPPNFERLLAAVLRLTAHPAKAVSYETFAFWTALLRELPGAAALRELFAAAVLPSFLACLRASLLKTGLPSEESVEGKFSRNEFSFDDDFLYFFGKYRYHVVCCVRLVCQHFPDAAFQLFLAWARELMARPLAPEELDAGGHCTARSPSLLHWEALSMFGDGLMTELQLPGGDAEAPPLPQRYTDGVALLAALLDACTRDPLVLSVQVSLLVGLLPFAGARPDLVRAVLEKLFSLLPYELPGQTKANRVKSVRNLRRHVSACMIRVARDQPRLVLPVFDALYDAVGSLCNSDDISVLEKCNLIEALLLLSQHLEDASKRRRSIETILDPVRSQWCSPEMTEVVSELSALMPSVGLTNASSAHEEAGPARCRLMNCVMTFYSVLKRVSSGAGQSEAFMAGLIMPVLPNVFRLFRTLNGLTSPEGVALRHADYADAFELTEHRKFALLGIPHPSSVRDNSNSPDTKKPCERMNSFLYSLYEHTCYVIGLAMQALPESLFVPLLYNTMTTYVLSHVEHLPDLKLCLILRLILKPAFMACPLDAYDSVLVPLTSMLAPLLHRLLARWQAVQELDTDEDDGDAVASEEVIMEQILRNLSRNYVDLLRVLLVKNDAAQAHGRAAVAMEDADMADEETAAPATPAGCVPSQLGPCALRLLRHPELVTEVFLPSLFRLLSVPDSVVSLKAAELVWPAMLGLGVVGESAGDGAAKAAVEVNEEMARGMLLCVLRGLQVHGANYDQHMSRLLSLGVSFYEALRPRFPGLKEVLGEATGRSDAEMQAFEHRLWPPRPGAGKPINEKTRRDLFRQLARSVVGVALSERFREERLLVPNLPQMAKWRERAREHRQRCANATDEDLGLVQLFQ